MKKLFHNDNTQLLVETALFGTNNLEIYNSYPAVSLASLLPS